MAYALVTNSALTDIADAIRDMNGSADTYLPSEFPDAIRSIEAGSTNPPEPVTGISAKIGHNKVGLLFDDPSDITYTTSYTTYDIVEWAGTRVVRKVGSAPSNQNDGTLVANSTVRDAHKTSHLVDTGLTNGTTYYYGLFPYSSTGKTNTDASQVISATPSPLGVGSASNLSLKVGSGKVLVKWSDPADVADTSSRFGTTWASTKLVRKAGSTPSDSSDGTLLATATTRNQYSSTGYLDETPSNGTAYYYAAFAQSADGVESSVVAASATPSAMGVSSCTGISVTAGNATATVKWTDPADVADTSTRYGTSWARTVLVRKAGSAPASASDGTVVVTETTRDQYKTSGYEDTGLTNGTTYYYAAFAVSSDGVTSAAATASGTPTAFDPSKVKWATSSWDDIATALQKHRAGEVDMTQYWHVGDVREVPFTLYKATVADTSGTSQVEPGNSSNPGKWYNGSSWVDVGSGVSFTTHWVIADVNDGSSSATATYKKSGEATPAFIINQVESIPYARFNYSNTNSGGWNSSALRKYLNGSYLVSGITGYYDGLPAGLRSILLPASVVAASGSSTTTATSTDKLFLPAEKEVFGSVSYANSTAESSLKQWDYFATAANRIKYRMGPSGVTSSAGFWWERSPYSGNSNYFCRVITDGTANVNNASIGNGLAPSGCI